MDIYCIRHTSVDIDTSICYGNSNIGLKDTYQEEKSAIDQKIFGLEFDKVFSSPLFRCRTLAEDLFPTKDIAFDKRLMEINFGDWELRPWEEIYAENPENKDWMNTHFHTPFPNGESISQMVGRIEEFQKDLLKTTYKRVAVVSHSGAIRILKLLIEGKSFDSLLNDFNPAYGEVVKLKYQP